MKLQASFVAPALLTLGLSAGIGGAEIGDTDGDGRLSIADVMHLHDGLPPAPGSLDGFERFPCFSEFIQDSAPDLWLAQIVPPAIYLESLRRNVPGSLPHWDSVWTGDSLQSPLPSTDAVEVQLLPMVANGGSDSFVEVQILFKVRKALHAVSLVLDSSGLLHPVLKEPDLARWPHNNWRNQEVLGQAYAEYSDELIFAVTPHTYLITGGKFVITYALDDGRDTVIDPGQYTFRWRSRLPIGTRAGRYTLHVLPGSEVLLGSGELASPTVVGPGELVVEKDVTEGYDEGIPPLQLDPQHRQVLGKVEFRLADANSRPAVPGGPLATAFPGEEFKVRVQMRTEMPLNQVSYVIQWPGQGLLCSSGALTNLFVNPEDGLNYEPHSFFHNVCASDASRGFIQVLWHLAGADDRNTPENYPGRPLEYFKPLGEWVDLTEILLSMDPDAAGGQDIPFQFIPYSARSGSEPEPPMFVPYQSTWPCYGNREPEGDYWSYDVRHESSFVRVLGKQPPPPAPDLGIRFKLGDVEAMPGETVEVPILASSEGPLSLLRLALEADPQAVAVESVDMAVQVEETGEVRRMVIPRGGRRNLLECHDDDNDGKPDRCDHGVPFLTLFAETEASFVLVDAVLLSGDPREYPGSSPFEIGRLHVRIREDATGHGTVLKPARVSFVENGLPVIGESGGYGTDPDDAGKFSPSVEVAGGKITFSVGQRSFVRGNANADEKVDLSDAVKILGYLFLGNTGLSCLDAADADDSGGLSITDPIYLLGFLFLGRQSIPEPYPACGTDPTTDELGCRQGCP